MRSRIRQAPAVTVDSVQLSVIEGGLDAAVEALPRLEPELRNELSACAVRFDAHVRRIRDAHAAPALPREVA